MRSRHGAGGVCRWLDPDDRRTRARFPVLIRSARPIVLSDNLRTISAHERMVYRSSATSGRPASLACRAAGGAFGEAACPRPVSALTRSGTQQVSGRPFCRSFDTTSPTTYPLRIQVITGLSIFVTLH